MASISINTKGTKKYAKFNDRGFPQAHLGYTKNHSIMMLKSTFKTRQYIETGKYTAQDLDKFVQKIEDNFI